MALPARRLTGSARGEETGRTLRYRVNGTLAADAAMLFANWPRGFGKHSNRLPVFDPDVSFAAGGDPNIVYYRSHRALAEDEALLVEVTPPECEHWNFQVNNYWMESLDHRYRTIRTNRKLARYEDDGSVRLVVAHRDPGLPNWLETAGHTSGTICFLWIGVPRRAARLGPWGHTSGTMCFRWIKASEHPEPRTRVVSRAELEALRNRRAPGA